MGRGSNADVGNPCPGETKTMRQIARQSKTRWEEVTVDTLKRRRPRVLQVVTRADLGGAQVHIIELLRGLKNDFDMVLAAGEEGFCTAQARALGIECYVLPGLVQKIDPLSDLKALGSTVQAIRKIRPDLVHCHTTKAGLIGRLAARLMRVPSVYTVHTWCFTEGTSRSWKAFGLPAETVAACWSRRIIAVSDANRMTAISKRVAPSSKLVTVHNGIADCPQRANPGGGDTPRLVMVARFVAQKNQALLIEAVASLASPIILTFVGDGPLCRQAEQLASSSPPHVKVEFLGQRQDVAAILARSSLFVLSTNWEGFPISILEAMRAGLPVVATDVDGVREAVSDGDNGLLVQVRDKTGLTQAIQRLISDPALRQRMGRRGRTIYEERFSLPPMLRKVTSVYALALGHPALPASASPNAC
jgi:glycosyltransferase involved in cell wall biosynthesis